MDIYKFKEQYFTKPFLPRWVGIDACFCFCAALLASKKGEQRDDSFSVIDLSTRLDSYPLPTSTELLSIEDSFSKEVDQFLRDMIENGVVRIRARYEFCELDYDYSKFRSESDAWESDSGKYWSGDRTIDYQNRQVILNDDPEGYLANCIFDYDYQLQTEGDAELTREVKAAVTDLQVSSEDLLASLSSLVETYRAVDTAQPIDIDLKAVTGKNRFFYSQKLQKFEAVTISHEK